MRFLPTRRGYLVPVLGIALVAAMSACSSSSSSSSSTPGSSSSAVAPSSSVRPPASSAPAVPASTAASGGTGASGGSAAAITQIKTNWVAFFSSSTPNSKRVQLLQNGSEFSSTITAFAASPLSSAVTSKVDSVVLNSATKATVKYDLDAAGTAVASGATGSSVLQNGVWKVGDDVFCGLLKQGGSLLNIKVPTACNSVS